MKSGLQVFKFYVMGYKIKEVQLKPYWRDQSTWICPKHLPPLRVPAHIEACWFSGCSSVRPPTEANTRKNSKGSKICAWHKCEKGDGGGRAIARKTSKYCSRDCSNRNARWRHKNK
jgi:hypothetical protein